MNQIDKYIFKDNCFDMIIENNSIKTILGADVLNDLEILTSYTGGINGTLFNFMDKLKLKGSKTFLQHIISNPIYSLQTLQQRNNVINTFVKYNKQGLTQNLIDLSDLEADVIWMFERNSFELKALYEMVYFNSWILEKLNNSGKILSIWNIYKILVSPILGIIMPITYFIIPYIILRLKLGLKMPFLSYLTLSFNILLSTYSVTGSFKWLSLIFTFVLYFQGLFNSIEIAKTVYKVSALITGKMNNVMNFIKESKRLVDLYWLYDIKSFFKQESYLKNESNYFKNEKCSPFAVYKLFGHQLSIFKKFKDNDYLSLYKRIYILDSLSSIACIKHEYNMCNPCFSDSNNPKLKLHKFYHPLIQNPVKNNVTFEKNIILTGPNAGGKSTLIKAILNNIILAQTCAICPAEYCIITPFKYINSQINIPDCKGKESLFEAEMYRAKENISMLEKKDGYSFIAMDEIFSSTNPIEGISGAFSIAKKISKYDKCCSILTTHYTYLTLLSKNHNFNNYKMNVDMINNDITYPYKLKKGVSNQYIALELLKKNGFEKDIIEDALEIKQKLLRLNK